MDEFGAWPELRRAPATFRAALRIAARNWNWGAITFVLPTGAEIPIHGPEAGPDARLVVRDYRFMRRVMAAGDIGFAEGYMAQEWDSPDLSAVLESAGLNFDRLRRLVNGDPLMRAVNMLNHLVRGNTKRGAQRNI